MVFCRVRLLRLSSKWKCSQPFRNAAIEYTCSLAAGQEHPGSVPATETTHPRNAASPFSGMVAVEGTDVVMHDDGILCDIEFVEDQDRQANHCVETAKHSSHEVPPLDLDIEFAEDSAEGSPAGLMCLQNTHGEPIPGVPIHVAAAAEIRTTVVGSDAAAVDTTVAPTGFEEVSAAFLADMLGQDPGDMCDVVFDQDWDGNMMVDASQSPQEGLSGAEIHETVVLASAMGGSSSGGRLQTDYAVLPAATLVVQVRAESGHHDSMKRLPDHSEEPTNAMATSTENVHTDFEDHAPDATDAAETNPVLDSNRAFDNLSKQEHGSLSGLKHHLDDSSLASENKGNVLIDESDHGEDEVAGMHRQPEGQFT